MAITPLAHIIVLTSDLPDQGDFASQKNMGDLSCPSTSTLANTNPLNYSSKIERAPVPHAGLTRSFIDCTRYDT